MLFNNVNGCCDRIPPNLAEIALRRIGYPPSVVRTHTAVQRNIKYCIITAYGISKRYMK